MFGEGYRSQVLAIVAALDEEQGVGCTIAELRQHLDRPRILIVDGRSTDRTVEIAKDLDAEIIFQKGKGDAVAQAVKQVNADVDYVVFTDADREKRN
jgi:dolichol-phosphate mannosyltransferase